MAQTTTRTLVPETKEDAGGHASRTQRPSSESGSLEAVTSTGGTVEFHRVGQPRVIQLSSTSGPVRLVDDRA
jgi:hypothetical protein